MPRHNYLYKILHRLTGTESLTLVNIRHLLEKMLDKFDTLENILLDFEEEKELAQKHIEKRHFKRPYKMLLIWAVLLNRYVAWAHSNQNSAVLSRDKYRATVPQQLIRGDQKETTPGIFFFATPGLLTLINSFNCDLFLLTCC